MCGRAFRYTPRDELAAAFRANPTGDEPPVSFNIAPSQLLPTVRFNAKTGERTLDALQWGLVPHFAQDRKIAWKLTNARGETVDRLPSYRTAFAKRRCLIPVDGFFEWRTLGKRKQPYAFALATHKPFALAGLWENWRDPASGAWLRSCTIITTEANAVVGAIHDRMPVMLEAQDYARWLGEEPEQLPELKALLKPFRAELMVSWPVSPAINKPGVLDDASVLDTVSVPEDSAIQPPE
jgi:putative SOS response-associated peptidase YedK